MHHHEIFRFEVLTAVKIHPEDGDSMVNRKLANSHNTTWRHNPEELDLNHKMSLEFETMRHNFHNCLFFIVKQLSSQTLLCGL
jgi:hypothetical protein